MLPTEKLLPSWFQKSYAFSSSSVFIVNNPMIYTNLTRLYDLCILVMSINLWMLDYSCSAADSFCDFLRESFRRAKSGCRY